MIKVAIHHLIMGKGLALMVGEKEDQAATNNTHMVEELLTQLLEVLEQRALHTIPINTNRATTPLVLQRDRPSIQVHNKTTNRQVRLRHQLEEVEMLPADLKVPMEKENSIRPRLRTL